MRLKKPEVELITLARVCRLSTLDRAGKPHCVPVCPLFDGKRIYFGTEKAAKKVRNTKYPQYEKGAALDEGDSVIVEVVPRQSFSWGL